MQTITGTKTVEDAIAAIEAIKVPEVKDGMKDAEKARAIAEADQTNAVKALVLGRLKALPASVKVIGIELRADVGPIEVMHYRIIQH